MELISRCVEEGRNVDILDKVSRENGGIRCIINVIIILVV